MVRATCYVLPAVALIQAGSAAVLNLPIWFRTTYALVNVSVGTPAESQLLLFDTGSATSWISDKKCADGGCKNFSGFSRTGYDLNSSTTGRSLGTYGKIDYLGGVTGGPAVRDVFQIDGTSWNQTFLAANESSWTWIPGDGFLGMAFTSIAEPNTKTLVETMMQDGLLDAPKFAIYYGKEFNYTGEVPGEGVMTIGASEEAKYVEGDMTWLPVRKDNGTVYQLWRSTLRKFTGRRHVMGGNPVNGSVEWDAGKANGVFDTGAGTITVPSSKVEDIYRSIGWDFNALYNGNWIPLCTDFNSSWSVTFSFSDDGVQYHDISISGEQLARNGYAGREDACVPPFEPGESNSLVLFGQSFLRRFYTVFDFGSTRVEDYKPLIGFGKLNEEYRPPVLGAK